MLKGIWSSNQNENMFFFPGDFFCYFSGFIRVSFPTPEGTKTTALELHALLTSKEANLGMVVFVPEVTLPKTDSLPLKINGWTMHFPFRKAYFKGLYY